MRSFLIAVLAFPGGVGALCLALSADQTKNILFRVFGAFIGVVLSPFVILNEIVMNW